MEAVRTEYQNSLARWRDADPDRPILRQAKAEYAKLAYMLLLCLIPRLPFCQEFNR